MRYPCISLNAIYNDSIFSNDTYHFQLFVHGGGLQHMTFVLLLT